LTFQGNPLKIKVVEKRGMEWKRIELILRGNEEGQF
jgi:hypothetical protein